MFQGTNSLGNEYSSIRAELSQVRSVLGLKCPYTVIKYSSVDGGGVRMLNFCTYVFDNIMLGMYADYTVTVICDWRLMK